MHFFKKKASDFKNLTFFLPVPVFLHFYPNSLCQAVCNTLPNRYFFCKKNKKKKKFHQSNPWKLPTWHIRIIKKKSICRITEKQELCSFSLSLLFSLLTRVTSVIQSRLLVWLISSTLTFFFFFYPAGWDDARV